ncbi:MAG: magnesium transporter MgtE [Selenomonadaceae bacterium]|nr:magnesium transporter MgtE [Selenomonadaceae bacterium]
MAKKKGGIVGKIVKFLLFLLLLLILTVGGFAAGVYFQLIDAEQTQEINEVLGLYKLPVVGEFFDKPEGVEDEETETNVQEIETNNIETVANGGNQSAGAASGDNKKKSRDVKVTQKDIEKMAQEREAAEKKRISKLARIYNNMKAEEAAQALGNLDYDTAILILQKMDEGAVGQILAKMDPSQAAQITQLLFEGTQSRVVLPSDLMQGREANEDTEQVQSNAQAQ